MEKIAVMQQIVCNGLRNQPVNTTHYYLLVKEGVLHHVPQTTDPLHRNRQGTAASSGWNLIEFEFNSDGDFNFWFNETWDFGTLAYTSGPSGTFASGTGTVEAVRLGTPNGMAGMSGTLAYDAYESHRTTPVGALLSGDADNSGGISVADVVAVLNELAGTLQAGQPDCNETGGVTVADAVCLINSL